MQSTSIHRTTSQATHSTLRAQKIAHAPPESDMPHKTKRPRLTHASAQQQLGAPKRVHSSYTPDRPSPLRPGSASTSPHIELAPQPPIFTPREHKVLRKIKSADDMRCLELIRSRLWQTFTDNPQAKIFSARALVGSPDRAHDIRLVHFLHEHGVTAEITPETLWIHCRQHLNELFASFSCQNITVSNVFFKNEREPHTLERIWHPAPGNHPSQQFNQGAAGPTTATAIHEALSHYAFITAPGGQNGSTTQFIPGTSDLHTQRVQPPLSPEHVSPKTTPYAAFSVPAAQHEAHLPHTSTNTGVREPQHASDVLLNIPLSPSLWQFNLMSLPEMVATPVTSQHVHQASDASAPSAGSSAVMRPPSFQAERVELERLRDAIATNNAAYETLLAQERAQMALIDQALIQEDKDVAPPSAYNGI
jgi:hypothetical protein